MTSNQFQQQVHESARRKLALENALKRLLQMQREVFECETLGDHVVHNSTEFEEVINLVREAL